MGALWLFAGAARADEVDDFLSGRDAFLNGEFRRACTVLRPVVLSLGQNPRLSAVSGSVRRVYAAALFADRREREARAAIEALLREDPTARLETAQFEPGFVQLFDEVSRALSSELERIAVAQAQARVEAQQRSVVRRELAMRLLTESTQVERVPRALMFLPFGVGQFANRQPELGVLFLSVEALGLGVSLATFFAYTDQYTAAQSQGNFVDAGTQATIRSLYIVNLVSAGVFAAFYLGGVIQANAVYRPDRVRTVPRPLPTGLDGVQISATPMVWQGAEGRLLGGASLRLRF
ncbi:MAG: hypothetical protein JNK72_19635 [Myxococcales bacterium]|nr:hypothetical protein [Myxococcales bacterium]